MEEKFSWKEISVMVLIIVIVCGAVIWFLIRLEKSFNEKDRLYEELCPKAGLELYKSNPDSPHWDCCYEINDGRIIVNYYLHKFNGTYYLREGLY